MTDELTELVPFKRGPGGRPTRAEAERRHGAMLDLATRLFLDRGFDAVTVEEIAKQAGVAKRFIYARYRDKSDLFVAAIEHSFMWRLEALHAIEPSRQPVEAALTQFAQRLIDLALQPDALALHRLFITVAPRFPELVQRFVERNRTRGLDDILRVLSFYAERGDITLSNPQLMAEQFFISVVGIPQRFALAGLAEPPAEHRQRLRIAVRLFLKGCAKD